MFYFNTHFMAYFFAFLTLAIGYILGRHVALVSFEELRRSLIHSKTPRDIIQETKEGLTPENIRIISPNKRRANEKLAEDLEHGQ